MLSVAKLKIVFAGKRNFSLNKAKKGKKNFFLESLDQCRRIEVREMARKLMFFVISLRLSDKVLHNIASSSSFLRFRSDFIAFFARILYFKIFEV